MKSATRTGARTRASIVALALSLGASGAGAQDVFTGFDAGPEGWAPVDLPFPALGSPPTVLNTFAPVWTATGGNPGGHVSLNDPSANVMYWRAPAAYLGNQSDKYMGTLSYSLRYVDGSSVFDQEDVVLVGAGLTLVFDINSIPSSQWTPYVITLHQTGWRVGSLTGANATAAQMQAVLGSLTALYIRGEFKNNLDDTTYLDSVRLTPGTTNPPTCCAGDADGSGVVNFDDLTTVLANFGSVCR